jgi:hypothetical protein
MDSTLSADVRIKKINDAVYRQFQCENLSNNRSSGANGFLAYLGERHKTIFMATHNDMEHWRNQTILSGRGAGGYPRPLAVKGAGVLRDLAHEAAPIMSSSFEYAPELHSEWSSQSSASDGDSVHTEDRYQWGVDDHLPHDPPVHHHHNAVRPFVAGVGYVVPDVNLANVTQLDFRQLHLKHILAAEFARAPIPALGLRGRLPTTYDSFSEPSSGESSHQGSPLTEFTSADEINDSDDVFHHYFDLAAYERDAH